MKRVAVAFLLGFIIFTGILLLAYTMFYFDIYLSEYWRREILWILGLLVIIGFNKFKETELFNKFYDNVISTKKNNNQKMYLKTNQNSTPKNQDVKPVIEEAKEPLKHNKEREIDL